MLDQKRFTRSRFLKVSAMAAVGVAVSSLVDGDAPAAEAQASYNEAPSLRALVQAGQLPPVEERMPQTPYVVPHKWLAVGKYGGTMQQSYVSADGWGTGHLIQESMYGHSPLRWLEDGLKIGPGLIERWESNEDASVWTFYFRPGLKWSDGHPWSVDDILFWWEDQVKGPTELKEFPPDEARSGRGTLMTLQKLDDYTMQMQFDAPAPLTADRLAMWVNRGIGPRWMDPKHYLTQFHIRYNPNLDPTKWVDDFTAKRDFAENPDCPTMTGWKLVSFEKGVQSTWDRNPYYWCVDKAGNQLPYIDRIVNTIMQDAEVLKLRYTAGQIDYAHAFHPLTLADVATLRQAEARSGLEVRFWDGGSGTSSMYFFNWNFGEPKMRNLVRNATFRKALSHAYNRQQVQRAVYFNTGELTAGTLSPKGIEYQVPGGKGVYQEWRDSAMRYDPDLAKRMLDQIGVRDVNGDGWREMPDGSRLEITIDYPASESASGEHVRKNELLAADWKAIGIKAELNPLPSTGYDDEWELGRILMKTAWEVGDGPNHLVYPQWLVPLERSRWAPVNGRWAEVRGTPKEFEELEKNPYERTPPREPAEPGSPIDRIWQLYDQSKVEPDPMQRHRLVWDMIKIHVEDGPFFSGTVANTPRIILVKKGLSNVPRRDDLALGGFVNPWIHPTPAVYDPEAYFWDNPDAHR